MKILIFGTGKYYQEYKVFFQRVTIVAFLDNDKNKQGKRLDNILIIEPQEGIKKEHDKIFILSIYFQEMKNQLISLGVDKKKIFSQDDLYFGLGENVSEVPLKIYGDTSIQDIFAYSSVGKRIALISYDLQYNGAGIVLLYAAMLLKNKGYNLIMIVRGDGPLYTRFLEIGIPVIVDYNLKSQVIEKSKWAKISDLIFVNTIHFYPWLLKHNVNKPIVWWLHDSEMIYQGKDLSMIGQVDCDDLSIYAVSPMAVEAFNQCCPNAAVKPLVFGIPDFFRKKKKISMNKFVLTIVGGISKRKGQHILLEAINLLPEKTRKACEFWLIGSDRSKYAEELKKSAGRYPMVKILGEYTRKQMEMVYSQIDVLLCPSLEETMSVVTIEAMMNYKPAIVSDHTGIAAYISPGENGLICKTGDAKDLAEKITWMAGHLVKVKEMGIEARKVYEQNFSMAKFEQNLLRVVKDNMGELNE